MRRCDDGWPAGQEASAYLYDLIRGRKVTCEPKTTDRYGRTVAICRADGRDLGADMVSAGMAWAFVRYSRDCVVQGGEARVLVSVFYHRGQGQVFRNASNDNFRKLSCIRPGILSMYVMTTRINCASVTLSGTQKPSSRST